MIKFTSLYSGSSGNSYFLQVDDNKFLVDVGVSRKKIVDQLNNIGEDINDIDAIFITHEHIDHIRGLSIINKNYQIPVYLNEKTFDVVDDSLKSLDTDKVSIFNGNEFFVNDTRVQSFNISHDAVDPVGYSFFDKKGNKATIVTDLGEVTEEVLENVSKSDLLVLEANYDDELIRYSPYPINIINRINSPMGHLSNSKSLALAKDLVDKGLKNLALAHISKSNNNYEIVSQIFEDEINGKKLKKDKINIKILKHNDYSDTIIIK